LFIPEITLDLGIAILQQIAAGMKFLHAQGITHRDLNPNNVLVYTLEVGKVHVRVADFGLSRELETGVTNTMTGFVGSPSYIAPEVLSEHAQYNEKADVYSFGIMIWYVSQHMYLARNTQLFRTATEHRSLMTPYRFETSPLQLMKKVVKGARPPIPPLAFPLHQDLQRLMQQCWQTEPLSRPSFEELSDEMDHLADVCAGLQGFEISAGQAAAAARNPLVSPPPGLLPTHGVLAGIIEETGAGSVTMGTIQ